MDETKANNSTLMGILSYLGPLVIVPLLVARGDTFVNFHIRQGLVLLVAEIGVWILMGIMWQFYMIWQLVQLAILVFIVLGVVNVAQGKMAELPLIGSFSKYFKI